MLILSRHENEAIVIGGCIKVTVVEIRGHQILLGIEAPREVAVRRVELRRLGHQGGIGRRLKSLADSTD
ncbi:MAG: carbon storage regulator [Thermoguttaceae bacterium]